MWDVTWTDSIDTVFRKKRTRVFELVILAPLHSVYYQSTRTNTNATWSCCHARQRVAPWGQPGTITNGHKRAEWQPGLSRLHHALVLRTTVCGRCFLSCWAHVLLISRCGKFTIPSRFLVTDYVKHRSQSKLGWYNFRNGTERPHGTTASRSGFYKNMIIYGTERRNALWLAGTEP